MRQNRMTSQKFHKRILHSGRQKQNSRLRKSVQGAALLLQNANFRGFFTGKIYQGKLKRVCVPGLNCYSCPGAVGACPIGSLQNTLSGWSFRFPYYVMGLLIFFGALLGRAVCGWICPFGLIQELLYRIPLPGNNSSPERCSSSGKSNVAEDIPISEKACRSLNALSSGKNCKSGKGLRLKKVRTFRLDKPLRKMKYFVLAFMVIILPVMVKLTPFFCKYLCPAGTLSGILLMLGDHSLFRAAGALWGWKVFVLALILFLSIIIFRPFCRYLCPLGAVYAPFNKVALTRMGVDEEKCTKCGRCAAVCGMCVDPSKMPDSTECIRCGKCVAVCPEHALYYLYLGSHPAGSTQKSWHG